MKIDNGDGTFSWQNADGSIVPYNGQDGYVPSAGGTTNTPAPNTSGTPKVGDVTETPYGSIILTGTDVNGNPTTHFIPKSSYADKVVNVGGKLVDVSTGKVIFDGTSGGGGGGVSPTTAYAQEQANARDAAALAEQQRQFNETFGYNKARGDQQQQVSEGQLSGVYRGQPTEQARQFNSKQALDYYTQLSAAASNPRNFMQNFFQIRGELPPAAYQQYGNVAALQRGNPGFNPQQFVPQFAGGAGVQSNGVPTTSAPTPSVGVPLTQQQFNPQQVAQLTQQAINPNVAGNIYSRGGANGTFANGTGYGAGGQSFQGQMGAADYYRNNPNAAPGTFMDAAQSAAYQAAHPVDPSVEERADLMQERKANPGAFGIAYAQGGVVPEPVIGFGVHSGKRYTFGENGPEGVVPASYLPQFLQQRHGQETGPTRSYAYGGIIGDAYGDQYADPNGGGTPYNPDPYSPPDPFTPTPTGGMKFKGGIASPFAPAPGTNGSGIVDYGAPAPTTPYYGPNDVNTPTPYTAPPTQQTPVIGPPQNAPGGQSNHQMFDPSQVADLTRGALAPVVTTQPVTSPIGSVNPIVESPVVPQPSQFIPSFVQQPQGLPQASNNFNANVPPTGGNPFTGATPGSLAPPGTFNPQATSPYSQFLPNFLPGEDTPLTSLLGQGALPPFLGRTFAQQLGSQKYGTNQPNPFVLPNGVPLISKLGASQMIPSERAAFESYISSFGITPEDYWNYVEQTSPQGGQSQQQNFGNRFQTYRQ